MPKTRKTLQLKNLAKYDTFIEDSSTTSAYFKVTNIPQLFTGGRNSFLLAGSILLKAKSSILIEILDSNGNPIYQNPVKKYIQGNSRLVSVEVNENVSPGFATIILMGQAVTTPNGNPIPLKWQNSYNVRWTKQILIEPNSRNVSPLILQDNPTLLAEEKRLFSINTSSYVSYTVPFTASLSPTLYSGYQIGYVIKAETPTVFSADYINSYITGSLLVDGVSASTYVPITNILNDTTAFSSGQLIKTATGAIIDNLHLYSGNYTTQVFGKSTQITSSVNIIYNKLNSNTFNIPISYAKLRVVNLNTVSGEIFKCRVYSKNATSTSDYKLIADIYTTTSELLNTGSIKGDLPIGNFNISPSASTNWYADRLETSSNVVYPISGSSAYYSSVNTITPLTVSVSDNVLLRSIRAEVPIYNNQNYDGYLSASGYFVGNKLYTTLFPSTEYTLQFNAIYKKTSGSINLIGTNPKVDIYIIGLSGTKIIDNNPLGQKIGTISVLSNVEQQWYQNKQYNFNPQISEGGMVGVRFVITNGFWYFSDISLKPASDKLFSPDEIQILVPNTDYFNEFVQHKVEFFDINNNSTDVFTESVPSFFSGSNIDLGTLP